MSHRPALGNQLASSIRRAPVLQTGGRWSEASSEYQCLQFLMENIMDLNALNNVHAWTNGVEVEPEVVTQIKNLASLPIVAGHVAIMPDVHLGKGATVGSVIPTRGAIIPAAVGGGRHRVRDVRGTHVADGERPAGLAGQGSLSNRSPGAGGLLDARQAGEHSSRRSVRDRVEAEGR